MSILMTILFVAPNKGLEAKALAKDTYRMEDIRPGG